MRAPPSPADADFQAAFGRLFPSSALRGIPTFALTPKAAYRKDHQRVTLATLRKNSLVVETYFTNAKKSHGNQPSIDALVPRLAVTELRVSWEHTFTDDGSKLVVHSNWISNTPATRAYLEAMIARVAEMESAPHCVFEKRKAVPPRSLPPDVGTFTSAEFWKVAELLHLQATPSLAAARLVLVEGMRPAKAARQLNTSPQALTNTLRKIRAERATSSRLGRLPSDRPASDGSAPVEP